MSRVAPRRGAGVAAAFAALLVLLVASDSRAQEEALDRLAATLLVERLGHPDFSVRDAAEAELLRRGAAVRDVLEAALASADAEIRLRAERCLDAIRRWERRRRFTSGTPVTIAGDGLSAEDVAARLSRAIERPVRVDPTLRSSRSGGIRLDFREKPFFEALDLACRALGADFEFDDRYDSTTRTFVSDVRITTSPEVRIPRTVFGPFLVSLRELKLKDERIVRFGSVDEDALDRKRDLTVVFQVRWEDGFPVVGHSEARVVEVVDADGRSMLPAGADGAAGPQRAVRSFGGLGRSARQSDLRVEVTDLPVDASRLDRLTCRATFVVPLEVGEILFEVLPDEGETVVRGEGDVVATLSRTAPAGGRSCTLSIERQAPLPEPPGEFVGAFRNLTEFLAIDAEGNRTAVGSSSMRTQSQRVDYTLQLDLAGTPPRAFAYRYVKELVPIDVTFTFEDLEF